MIGNVWSRDLNPLYDSMVRTYQDVFDDLYIIDVYGTGNRILLALPRKRSLRREDLVELARKVARERDFPFDLADLGEKRFIHAVRRNSNVRVLSDADTPPRTPREDRQGARP